MIDGGNRVDGSEPDRRYLCEAKTSHPVFGVGLDNIGRFGDVPDATCWCS